MVEVVKIMFRASAVCEQEKAENFATGEIMLWLHSSRMKLGGTDFLEI